jgi:hypothetical protein
VAQVPSPPGSTVTLTTAQTVTADDAYLDRSITSPDAQIVKGYHSGLMAPAISPFHLAAKPGDRRAEAAPALWLRGCLASV